MKNLKFFLIAAAVAIAWSCASSAPPPPPPPPPPPADPAPVAAPVVEQAVQDVYERHHSDVILTNHTTYTVKEGDTLASIAAAHYRSSFDYPLILIASSDVVTDHDVIEPGMVLTLPDLNLNLGDAKAKQSLKVFFLEMAAIEDTRGRTDTAAGLREEADRM